jgi:sugar/nucleoside kinase (ribokinase family)
MNKRILGIGNAIVDVFAHVDEKFLNENNLIKGSMKLINENEFRKLKKKIKIEKTLAGGSVANSMAGISYLKGKASFLGKINLDEFGKLYKKSLKEINVEFIYNEKEELVSTGTCIILITPDTERTMCTYLGISSQLGANDLNETNIANKELIFLEGYLWDKGESEMMFKKAINFAKKNRVKIAMTLSDIFCVTRHKEDFYNLLKNDLDILFGNENEINELTNNKNLINSINQLISLNKLIVITRSEQGSIALDNNKIISCDSEKISRVVDLTGAGDLFAAVFLKEYLEKNEIKKCLASGSTIAAKIIQKIGARL